MPTIAVTPDENGRIMVGNHALAVAEMLALIPTEATGKALKLQDGRVTFRGRPEGADRDVTFTVALTIQREPLNEQESAAITAKAEEQAKRKSQKLAEEQAVRDREIRRATDLTIEVSERMQKRLDDARKLVAVHGA